MWNLFGSFTEPFSYFLHILLTMKMLENAKQRKLFYIVLTMLLISDSCT